MWLVATPWDSADLEQFLHCRRFHWTVLLQSDLLIVYQFRTNPLPEVQLTPFIQWTLIESLPCTRHKTMIFLKVPVSGRSEINGGAFPGLAPGIPTNYNWENKKYYNKFQCNLGAQKKNIQCVGDPEDNNLEVILLSLKIACSLFIFLMLLLCSLVFYL